MPDGAFARCWDSVEECLTADRLERIQQVLNAKKDFLNHSQAEDANAAFFWLGLQTVSIEGHSLRIMQNARAFCFNKAQLRGAGPRSRVRP